MADHIKAVFAWIGENRPQLLGQFNPPATDAEIDALQSVIEHPLPADLIALYKTHNGQSDENLAEMVALFGVFTLMPIAAIVGSKQETDPMIGTDFDEPEWWS
ncbi:MAG: SMI1/KNR4 family protein, partial [Pseudomonadota bacterium]